MYNRQGRKVNVSGYFKGLKPGGGGGKTLYYEHGGEYKVPRFRVSRKTKEVEGKGLERLRKAWMRKHGDKELSEAQTAYKPVCDNSHVNKRCSP
jgi:hypothetical protein